MAMAMASLPFDVVYDILSLLSAKTLLRLRSVSKSYRETIDDPDFEKARISKSNKRDLLLFHFNWLKDEFTAHMLEDTGEFLKKNSESPLVNLPLKSSRFWWDQQLVVCACNGVLLMRLYNHRGFELALCNPLRAEIVFLPPTIQKTLPSNRDWYGLGVDDNANEIKVVCIHEELCLGAEVYSSKTELWKKTEDWRKTEDCPLGCLAYYSTVENGSIRWIACKKDFHDATLCFHIKTEKFRLVPELDYNPFTDYKVSPFRLRPDGFVDVTPVFKSELRNKEEFWCLIDGERKRRSLHIDINNGDESEMFDDDDQIEFYEIFNYKSSLISLTNYYKFLV